MAYSPPAPGDGAGVDGSASPSRGTMDRPSDSAGGRSASVPHAAAGGECGSNARLTLGSWMTSAFLAGLQAKWKKYLEEAGRGRETQALGGLRRNWKAGGNRLPRTATPSSAAPADCSNDDDFVEGAFKKRKVPPDSEAAHAGGSSSSQRTHSSPRFPPRPPPPRSPAPKKHAKGRKLEGEEQCHRVGKACPAAKKTVEKLVRKTKANVRCYPKEVLETNQSLNKPQREYVGSWDITNDDVMLAQLAVDMDKIDWCQLIYTDLCHSVEKWQKRNKNNQTATMYGCCIVLLTLLLPDDQLYDTQFARRIDHLVRDQFGRDGFDDAETRTGSQDGTTQDQERDGSLGCPRQTSRWMNLQQSDHSNTPNSMFHGPIEKGASGRSIAGEPMYDKTPFAPATGADDGASELQNNKEASICETSQDNPVFDVSMQKEKVMYEPKIVGTSGSCVSAMMTDELEPCSVLVMKFGDGLAYGKDIMMSFGDGRELEDLFVDFAIECISHDDRHIYSLPEVSCVFLGSLAMRHLNAEHLIHKDQLAPAFSPDPLLDVLNTMLPSTEAMKNTQLIFLITTGSSWKDFHHQTMSIYGKLFRFIKLIINRLTTTLHKVRPKCWFPKFGKWSYKFEHEAPSRKYGSNDCDFFIIKYLLAFDTRRGLVDCVIDRERSADLRAEIVEYLTFHDCNEIRPLPKEVARVTQFVHIVDSNPYGAEMNFTAWKDFHHQTMSIYGKLFRFIKLIINRLTTTLHKERSADLRAEIVEYLTFHDCNEIRPLPKEVARPMSLDDILLAPFGHHKGERILPEVCGRPILTEPSKVGIRARCGAFYELGWMMVATAHTSKSPSIPSAPTFVETRVGARALSTLLRAYLAWLQLCLEQLHSKLQLELALGGVGAGWMEGLT
ncbi:uncharacterized protein C2845_PM05G22620 [Panicum miliaceum]|uniref:Ubiquitin-like protease family profile domain-containing protein n=1 Tax=Panicum miliaceum TaxID=4540 RepID=A0A3L6SX06_PANMI|nr:uncharacterized protein C2845_PM05G22620 [Panicum miliaceum]